MRKKLAAFAAALLALPLLFSCGKPETLRIIALKAGKADCFVVLTKNGCTVIDTAESGDFDKLDEVLKDNGVKRVDNLVVTHFDKDHVGGAARLIGAYEVKNIFTNDRSKVSDEYTAFIEALKDRERIIVREKTLITQDGLTIALYPPPEQRYAHDDSNNASLAASLEFGGKRLLFLADVLDERIAELEKEGVLTDCDLLKVPHHGSYENSTQKLVDLCRPEYALITCSEKNPADEKVLNILEKANAKVYLTSEGSLTVTVTESGITVKQ